jgi:hypothetical protein
MALPGRAAVEAVGDGPFTEIFHPIAHRLLARCDAVLGSRRLGGRRRHGGDRAALDLRVFFDLSETPTPERRLTTAAHEAGRVRPTAVR